MKLTPEYIDSIAKMIEDEAKKAAAEIIRAMKKVKDNVKTRLIADINKAPSVQEIVRIMWQILLAGEGHRVQGGSWEKTYYGK